MVAFGSIACTVAGRFLGIAELFAVSAAMVALLVGAALYVRLNRFSISAVRQLHPSQVHVGASSRVDLTVQNTGTRGSPVLAARDPFDRGRRWARFSLAPLTQNETARAAYRLPTDQRGVFPLGPLEMVLADPFGLASATSEVAGQTALTVYPHIDRIRAMPDTQGPDPHNGAGHPIALSQTGEDFYALREYQTGDDLRRVHWPSTARLDELMIRQDDMPWQGRATVLVDLRRAVHTDDSFELALSAAASIVDASVRRSALVRLVASDGVDSGFGSGRAHLNLILERLAAAKMHGDLRLPAILTSLRRAGAGGALTMVTTARVGSSDLDAMARLRARYGSLFLVLFERSATEPGSTAVAPRPVPALGPVVRVTAEQPFPVAWDRMVASASGPRTRASR
ncbi:MAG: hypothetical protein QOG64_2714 [Acidimicrobiaceae bacterium]|jgi:uncharacterized protein (DUF58 family)|nr:hypothetical protein [Acidimicrobiaceae bacterium]